MVATYSWHLWDRQFCTQLEICTLTKTGFFEDKATEPHLSSYSRWY